MVPVGAVFRVNPWLVPVTLRRLMLPLVEVKATLFNKVKGSAIVMSPTVVIFAAT